MPGADRARHADGVAVYRAVGGREFGAAPVEQAVRAERGGRLFAVLDHDRPPARQPDQHEPAAAEPAGHRAADPLHRCGGDGRVHGVAARLQDLPGRVQHPWILSGCRRSPPSRDVLVSHPRSLSRAGRVRRGGTRRVYLRLPAVMPLTT